MGLLHGIGINDADYNITVCKKVNNKVLISWRCPYYTRWAQIIHRCYSKSYHKTHPSYISCTICEEWKLFSNFKRWMEQQDWKGKELDKDILVIGNTVYGPDTCYFVSGKVNKFFRCYKTKNLPIGVSFEKYTGKFKAQCGEDKTLGRFEDSDVAHKAWQKVKYEQAIALYLQESDSVVKQAIHNFASSIREDMINNIETKGFSYV